MADFSINKVQMGWDKTPFHRLVNQFSIKMDTTGITENTTFPAGTYLRVSTDVADLVMEAPDTKMVKPALVVGDKGFIQGVLAQDVTVKSPGDKVAVSMAFGGVLYSKVMDLVNATALTTAVVKVGGSDAFKKNFQFYGVRKASTSKNTL